ncbi:MAG: ferrochelatase [Acidobacteria bacterium]|nr:ferrochelatase [Acidobacteriota bacterium]
MMRTGVLVMAYGTPSSPEAIEAYYTRIRHGRPPTPELLDDLTRRYQAIGGISPLRERTDAQVEGIRRELEVLAPGRFDVRFGSKYEPPLLEEPASSFRRDGLTHVIGLVLAPHSSSMSTDQYMARAAAELEGVTFTPITQWWDVPGFSELIARRVQEALVTIPEERREDALVLFSAHSLPERILAQGDTYPDQLRQSAEDVARVAGITHMDIAWQSAGRTPEPWIGPDILDVVRAKAAAGVTDIVSCPIGFVSDHLEVLYDIDIETQAVAREVGVNLVRTASLNDDPDFMGLLARVVLSRA